MKVFDTHCHLTADDYKTDLNEVLNRSEQTGVLGLALISADEKSMEEAALLQKQIKASHPQLKVVRSAGIHPHDAKTIDTALWEKVKLYAATADAIGETGLDYHYNNSVKETQIQYFNAHIELSSELQKPLVIHCREAADDVYTCLNVPSVKNHKNPGVLHCFTESADFGKKVLDLGLYISLSGVLSFKNAQALRDTAAQIPLDRILVETDSPWLAPIPHRGKRNEPAFTALVLKVLAEVKKMDPEELGHILWKNSCTFYGVPA